MTIAAIGIRDDGFLVEAAERAETITRRAPAASRPVDLIFYGVDHRDGLGGIAALVRRIKPDGAVWIVRPKGRREITEAETMAAGKRAGLVDVKVVSFSDTHTAEKFVIPVAKRAALGLGASAFSTEWWPRGVTSPRSAGLPRWRTPSPRMPPRG